MGVIDPDSADSTSGKRSVMPPGWMPVPCSTLPERRHSSSSSASSSPRGWIQPSGVTTLVPRNDWGTDHMAFDAVGLPSFDLLQDQLDYWSHTHHSNVDTVDHILPGDLMISAAFLASLVYHAATRDERLPREALPPPLPPPKALPEILREK